MINKKVPMRMCIACRESNIKDNFIRVVKTPEGFVVDNSNKVMGRSAYICRKSDCINKVIKNRLINKSFKHEIPSEVYNHLQESMNDD